MSVCVTICESCGSSFTKLSSGRLCTACVVGGSTMAVPRTGSEARVHFPAPVESGSSLPGHDVLEVIATGGMGAVHRARQDSLQRDVAVKIIRADRASEEDTERFLR